MELISYNEFGRLRLREFCGDEVEESGFPDWEWMDGHWFRENIGFTWFGRLSDMPDETGSLEIYHCELTDDVLARIFALLGLPLSMGLQFDAVVRLLDQPIAVSSFVDDRKTYEFKLGSQQPYQVSCTIQNEEGLIFVSMIREDVLAKIQAG